MYLYQVTNLTTGQFYIAHSMESKKTFDPIKQVDPYDRFISKLPAGSPIYRCIEKRMLTPISDMEQLSSLTDRYMDQFSENQNFLGVLESRKSTTNTRSSPKLDPVEPAQKNEPNRVPRPREPRADTTVSDS